MVTTATRKVLPLVDSSARATPPDDRGDHWMPGVRDPENTANGGLGSGGSVVGADSGSSGRRRGWGALSRPRGAGGGWGPPFPPGGWGAPPVRPPPPARIHGAPRGHGRG